MPAIQTFWLEADSGKKTGIVIGVIAILAFIVGASIWLLRTDYQVLFSDMDQRDAATVVSELERLKIDYRLEEAGTRIVVPGDVVHQVRLKLMGSEMPIAGTVGLEIFNDSDFGMTEFAQKVNFQRALQGELTRTIMSLDEVKYARVHLVMPESGLFKSQGKEPSASVTLFLINGRTPEARIISGIQRLVSSSVPELESEMVVISDQRGQTLSTPPTDKMGIESISRRLQKQQDVEKYYREKIIQLLDSRYESENIAVSVNVSLSFDQIRVTREGVLGEEGSTGSGVLRRRESTFGIESRKEKSKGTQTTEVEYELGRQIEQTIEAPGRIIRISVGIMVPAQLDERQRMEINKLVSMAIGYDESRGDAIAVYSAQATEVAATQGLSDSEVAPTSLPLQEDDLLISPEVKIEQRHATSGINDVFVDTLKRLLSDPLLFVLAGMALLLVLLLLGWMLSATRRGGREAQVQTLSQDDREQVLIQIQEWLAGEENKQPPREVNA